MTLRSDLTTEIEKALQEIVYDGGNGAMTEVEFTRYVRSLAETAVEAVDELRNPAARTQLIADARERLAASRLGKSITREMDADILIIRRLVEALETPGEPSDVELAAAAEAFAFAPYTSDRAGVLEPLRAALRAAAAVRGTGGEQ